MGQRNMPCTSQMIDLEMDQQSQGYLLHEPCVVFGGVTGFPQPDMQTIARSSANTANLDAQQHYDGSMFYGIPPQYHGVHPPHPHHAANLDLGVATTSNFYFPYMPAPSSCMPVNHGSSDQLPSSSNYGVIGVSADEYERNNHFMNHMRGPYKRKNAEGIPGTFQYFNAPASSSSSVAPLNPRHPDGVSPMDTTCFSVPQYRGNSSTSSIREVESQRSVRNRLGATAMDPVLANSHNQFFQGHYIGQPFQPAGSLWLDQPNDAGASTWTQAAGLPYHGSNVSGAPMETGNMAVQRFHDTVSNRSSSTFPHPPPMNIRHHGFHHPSPPIQGVRSHNMNVHPQVAAASYRVPSNYAATHSSMNLSQDGLELAPPRHLGPVQPSGFRIYRSPREGAMPEATLRQRNLPHLRVLPSDGVAVLELPDFYEVGNFIDHHRDMRLDIEDMSYEELLALGERIGNVNTGLAEETVSNKLKTRTYLASTSNINLEEPADQGPDSCIICQEDYRNNEKIGSLDCGHEYHEDCLKKWLFVKNVCPICKSEALGTKQ